MSFTVIGDTVNTAARLLTRTLQTPLVVGDLLVSAARGEPSEIAAALTNDLQDRSEQVLRGRAGAICVRTLRTEGR
jgi:class 3 adenylate cyclase